MIWWVVLTAGAIALVISGGKGPNAVWGTATVGVLVGIVLHFIYPGHFWWTMGRSVAVAALIGFVFELLPLLPKMFSK